MKTFKLVTLALIAGVFAVACQSNGTATKTSPDFTAQEIDSVSIAVGKSLASMVRQSNFGALNDATMMNAFKEVLNQEEEPSQDELMQWNGQIQNYMQQKIEREGERNLAAGKAFMESNKANEGVVELPSGLQYKILVEGNEVHATATDTVECHYVGTNLDGTEFDSSYKRNEPAKFPLNRVIPAWTEGMQLVGEGGKIMLYAPADLAYGPQGAGNGAIAPNATIIFEVEVIKIHPAAPAEETK